MARHEELTTPLVSPQAQERLVGVLQGAFLPLVSNVDLTEEGHVQVRVLAGSAAIHIEEQPLYSLTDRDLVEAWVVTVRRRVEELGYPLDPWRMPGSRPE